MKFVRINTDGSLDTLSMNKPTKNIPKCLEKHITSKGTTELKELYRWNYEDKIILCYGWYDGDAGFENEHNLIPNGNSPFLEEESSEKLLFGNIFLFTKTLGDKYTHFTEKNYEDAYNALFDGFDDCDDSSCGEDDIEDEDIEDDTNFIVNDSDMEAEDSYEYNEEDELDEDLNEY
jgi:hypothetical protein